MQKKIAFLSFFISLPAILYLLILILPTFDDWTYLTAPYFSSLFEMDRMLPWNGYWRPFDALIGSLLGLNFNLFPTLNHCLILLAHATSTFFVYRLTDKKILPTAFFFLSPGMLGTLLDIDSINQAYATCWGLFSLLLYQRGCKWQWMACVIIATFCKENGIMYAVIPPMLSYAKEDSWKNIKPYVKDSCPMMALVVAYGIARILLTSADNSVRTDYLTTNLIDHAKDVAQYIAGTWLPMDYAAIAFKPTRNLPLAIITFIMPLPFLFLLAKGLWYTRKDKIIWTLIAVYFLSAAPHLLTLVAFMHIYAGLPFAAMIIGRLENPTSLGQNTSSLGGKQLLATVLFFSACLISDIHHWHAAYQSGLMGKDMAEQIIEQSKSKPQKVFVLTLDNGETKYSIFNVIPSEAFGWGLAARHYSGYTMANEINDTVVTSPTTKAEKELLIRNIAEEVKHNYSYDAFWVVDGRKVIDYKENKQPQPKN